MTFEIKSGFVGLQGGKYYLPKILPGLETDAWRQQGDELGLSGKCPDVITSSQHTVSSWCSTLSHNTGSDVIDQNASNGNAGTD